MAASSDSTSAAGSAGHSPAEPHPPSPAEIAPGRSPDASPAAGPRAAADDTIADAAPLPTGRGGQGATPGADTTSRPDSGATSRPAAVTRAWRGFRGWRHSRPFWGGLLLLLGGGEVIASESAPLPVIIHLGAQGLAGYVLPVIIVVCGVLIWFNPAQRVFYSILAVLASLATFITSNLGGFLIGMLLGIVGGSLAFAWAPGEPTPRGKRRRPRRPPGGEGPSDGLDLLFDDQPGRMAALAAPLVAAALLAGGLAPSALAAAGAGRPAAAPAGCILGIICGPSPSPSPSPDPSPTGPQPSESPSATPGPTPSVTPSPTASGSPGPTPSPTRSRRPHARHAAGPAALAAAVPATITAGRAVMNGLSYDGVASVATANGTVPMLKFSMSSMTLSGGTVLTVTANGQTVVTRNSSLAFSGHVVLYTTKISADYLGVPLTFTPQSPPPLVLPYMVFTNVVTQQPYTMADSLQADSLSIVMG